MKRSIIALTLLVSSALFTQAQADHGNPNYGRDTLSQYGLILGTNLPHLMKPLMKHRDELNISSEQRQQLKALRQNAAPKIHSHLQQAKKLEKQIAQQVLQQQTGPSLDTQLDQIADSKRQATEQLIKAIQQIQKILTAEQYQTLQNKLHQP